jgi:hypothetical protein
MNKRPIPPQEMSSPNTERRRALQRAGTPTTNTERRQALQRASDGRNSYSYRPQGERVAVTAMPEVPPTMVHLAKGDAVIHRGAFVRLKLPSATGEEVEVRLTAAQARAIAIALLSAVDG